MKILIVEDEKKLNSSLKKGLEEQGFAVDVAYNGIEGKKLAFANQYKVIVSDIVMPQSTGLQMLKALRQNNIHTPVLMLTALNMVEEKLEVYAAGADDYLTKPFDFRELVARIRALIKRLPKV
ncbi:MAG TPA: response regulator, partial [Saprospiraceae bacterium]|nr:response regulator [Saprospiraceae bacterium]